MMNPRKYIKTLHGRTTDKINPQSVPLIVYHKNCRDGAFAAAAVYQWLVSQGIKKILTHPLHAGPSIAEEDEVLLLDQKADVVFMVDVMSPRLYEELPKLNPAHFIDHHQSASALFYAPPSWHKNSMSFAFGEDISAALMAARQYDVPEEWMPLYELVSLYDTGHFDEPNVRAASAALDAARINFNDIKETIEWIERNWELKSLLEKGEALVKEHDAKVQAILEREDENITYTRLGQGDALFACIELAPDGESDCINDIGDALSTLLEHMLSMRGKSSILAGVMMIRRKPEGIYASLRTKNDRLDLTAVAKCVHPDGGGHRKAAGFRVAADYDFEWGFLDAFV